MQTRFLRQQVQRNLQSYAGESLAQQLYAEKDPALHELGLRLLNCVACNKSPEGQHRRCDIGIGSVRAQCSFNAEASAA
jgi:hypothetical protein